MVLAPSDCLAAVRVFVVGVLVLFAPGWLLQAVFLQPFDLTTLARIPIAFVFSVASTALLGVGVYLLGGNLLHVQILWGLWLLVLCGLWVWRARTQHPISRAARRLSWPDFCCVVFAFAVGVVACYEGTWLSHQADDFYHMAAVRHQIDTGVVLVKGLMYVYDREPTGLNPSTGTWHLVLSILSLWSNVDITWLWQHLPAVTAPLLTFAFYALACTLVKRRWLALLSTVLQFVLYENLDFRASVWPNQVGNILLWVALLLVWRYVDSGRGLDLVFVLALAVAMASWHLLMIEFFLLAVVAYLAFLWVAYWLDHKSPLTIEIRRLVKMLAIVSVGAIPLIALRTVQANFVSLSFSSLLALHEPGFRSTLELGHGWSVIGPRNLSFVGPRWRFAPYRFGMWLIAYLTLPFLLRDYLKRDRAAVFLLGVTAAVPLIMLNPPLITFLQGKMTDIGLIRLVLLPPYGLLLGGFFWKSIGWWVRAVRRLPSSGRWGMASGLAAATVVLILLGGILAREGAANLWDLFSPVSANVYSLTASHGQMRDSRQPAYRFVLEDSPHRAVVAADPESGYYLAGLTGRRVISVAARHEPPGGGDDAARRRDSLAILDPLVGSDETVRLLDRYHVCLIWVDAHSAGYDPTAVRRKFESQPVAYTKVYEDATASIYRYRGSGDKTGPASTATCGEEGEAVQ
jgi:hypothetical protein